MKAIDFLILFLMLSSVFFATDASKAVFSPDAIKAGPSPGEEHKIINAHIKNSGPSPAGEGHKYLNAKPMGGIKDSSGPSPGAGH